MPYSEQEIRCRFKEAGQEHVLDHFATLSEQAKSDMLEQLDSIQVEKLNSLLQAALKDQNNASQQGDVVTPFSQRVGRTSDTNSTEMLAKCRELGMDAVQKGQVAALVLAGGQGTRLGFDGPKGKYDIGLPSGRTLFQLIAERIGRLRQLANDGNISNSPSLPFYVMTSPVNHDETVAYFKENANFGLPDDGVVFFQQGMLPCVTIEGKIIMESAGKVAMAPDGNGGIYPSLLKSGTLNDMNTRGIKYLHVFSIDNSLVTPADPVFIGYCISQGADCGNKVLWKDHAHEKVGVVAEKDGKPCIVEYSDISTEMAERTDEQGRLVFGAGNICNHFYTLEFINNVIIPNMGDLYHVAKKKIPYYDATTKETVTSTDNNGIKLESFIFDVFPLSHQMAVLDVERSREFAPVKNAPGSPSDSPDTARAMISALFQKWVIEAGGSLIGDRDAVCEVAPATSYTGEGLEDVVKGKKIECPFSL